ncbi:fatty acid desaturase family protein [Roseateles sp. DB2]|uniref:fatty acid desaturase family protein n=1 Tax=Roseateles sp. DB2 TaxID=3453717 RepID=UPI003EECB5BA
MSATLTLDAKAERQRYEAHCMADRRIWPWLGRALLDWAGIALAMACSLWAFGQVEHWALKALCLAPGMWMVGVFQHRLALLAHDAGHRTICPNGTLNDLLAVFFVYGPLLVSLDAWRMFHNEGHHPKIHTGTLRDPELVFKRVDNSWGLPIRRSKVALFTGMALCGGALPGAIIFILWMASPRCFARINQLLMHLLKKSKDQDSDILPLRLRHLPRGRRAIARDLALGLAQVLLRLALLTAFAYGVGQALDYAAWPLLLALWFGGYATGFWAVFRLRGYCEHVGAHTLSLCEPSPLWRFFVFPHGAWAHQLHHEMPGLPFHRYRDVLRRRGSLGVSPGDVFRLFESSPPLASGEVPAVDADANLMRRANLQGLLRTAVGDAQGPALAAAMEER